MSPRIPLLTLLFALGLALAGCAGLPLQPSKQLAATAAPVDLTAAQDMISTYRKAHGLSLVVLDPVLARVAQNQAMAMARADVMSHTVDGSLMARLDGAGAANKAAIENVSAGYETLPSAIAGWQHSPEHNANLLDPKMPRMGIAAANAPGSRFKLYWALDMTD
ncbi:MAG TPA: CAP domain-containing protein [Beijerinckiaceae bacterium]|jgi:uncharacterized protein YkwD|nr:CAP domain-containing protein [Beijerinckiaceae bacterium]